MNWISLHRLPPHLYSDKYNVSNIKLSKTFRLIFSLSLSCLKLKEFFMTTWREKFYNIYGVKKFKWRLVKFLWIIYDKEKERERNLLCFKKFVIIMRLFWWLFDVNWNLLSWRWKILRSFRKVLEMELMRFF